MDTHEAPTNFVGHLDILTRFQGIFRYFAPVQKQLRVLFELSARSLEDLPARRSFMQEAMQLLPSLEPTVTMTLARGLEAAGRTVEAAKVGVVPASELVDFLMLEAFFELLWAGGCRDCQRGSCLVFFLRWQATRCSASIPLCPCGGSEQCRSVKWGSCRG